MQQYAGFKKQYPEYLLLFRMGDFYEMFGDDAKTASRELGIALTSRSKGANAVPLAGIPYHALDNYLGRLIKAGHKVAICEQVEDPKQAKGVVKRDVVRLVTPGTLTDETLLDRREGNYLASAFCPAKSELSPTVVSISWVELSSGAFNVMQVPVDHCVDELIRIAPAELLVAEGSRFDNKDFRNTITQCTSAVITVRPPWEFDRKSAIDSLNGHFKTATLEGFGVDINDGLVCPAGSIITYLTETQKTALSHITSLQKFNRSDHMVIDGNTLRCLEVTRTLRHNSRSGTLLSCIDKTATGMGARLLERWLTFPLTNYTQITARQDAVEELVQDRPWLEALREQLKEVAQIDRIATNIALNRVKPRELVALGTSLENLPELCAKLSIAHSSLLKGLIADFEGFAPAREMIDASIDPDCPNVLRDGGVIKGGFNEELDRLRRIGADGQSWLAQYQSQQAKRLGISNLKVGYNKVFGYYIELSHGQSDKAPPDFHRKQTLKNAERYITDELKKYESEVLTADDRAKNLESQLFEQVRVFLAEFVPAFQQAAKSLAKLDVLCGLAQISVERGYVRPTITQDNVLEIVGGKHPVLEQQLREEFVPNDVKIGSRNDRLLIITGPNMAGKSTYIRQVALLTLLAQTGSFIPAEAATIGLVDRIFTRVGAADELTRGLSTFMLEMVETANILNNATSRSLVILDEVGRGTSTCDGLALAWAICEYIALKIKCKTLFATHYHELTELEQLLDGTTNLNVAVREWADEVIFLHRIIPGGADQSYGVHVARLAGVPKQAIERAKAILPQLQAHLAKGLDMPELTKRAELAAAQMKLFADPATRIAQEIKGCDLENITPMQALDMLRRFKGEL